MRGLNKIRNEKAREIFEFGTLFNEAASAYPREHSEPLVWPNISALLSFHAGFGQINKIFPL